MSTITSTGRWWAHTLNRGLGVIVGLLALGAFLGLASPASASGASGTTYGMPTPTYVGAVHIVQVHAGDSLSVKAERPSAEAHMISAPTARVGLVFFPKSVAANTAADGYSSFPKARTAFGSPGPGNVYDHVVEQPQIARSGFTPESIHNPANLNPVSARVNQLKANYYSTKPHWADGGRVRDWLNGQSFAEQHAFGMQVTQDILNGTIGGAG